jgi:hypothetical protein
MVLLRGVDPLAAAGLRFEYGRPEGYRSLRLGDQKAK